MKLKLTFFIVASIFACAASWNCTESDWAKYKKKYDKFYDSTEKDLSHKNTFCEAIINAASNNRDYGIGESNHEITVGVYTDLSPGEQAEYRKSHGFKRRRGGSTTTPKDEDYDLE